MSYKIGSFNMRNISEKSLSNENARNLQLIAKIIREEGFDVVALQEVLSEGKAFVSPGYAKKSILMELGKDWDFEWAVADSNADSSDSRDEGYAFLWNKKRLRLSSVSIAGKGERVFYPRMCNLNKKDLIRRPYYARFTPTKTQEGGPWIELRLLCVHTYFGNDDSKARERRDNELDILLTDIYPQISDRRYGDYGNGMPSYTILMGDYNVQLYRSWKEEMRHSQNAQRHLEGKSPIPKPAYLKADKDDIVESVEWDHKRIKTVQYEPTTLKSIYDNKEDDSMSRGYVHDYDHFSYEEAQFEGVHINAKRIDAVRKYCCDDFEAYHKKVSDHIPIMMELTFEVE